MCYWKIDDFEIPSILDVQTAPICQKVIRAIYSVPHQARDYDEFN